jgi:hypothetical protein
LLKLKMRCCAQKRKHSAMTLPPTEADKLARSLLANQGIEAIWKVHQAAAAAHRAGFRLSAADLIEVAEAAERAWVSDGKSCFKGGLTDLIASLR